MVPIDEDGKITLYGVQFQVEESKEETAPADREVAREIEKKETAPDKEVATERDVGNGTQEVMIRKQSSSAQFLSGINNMTVEAIEDENVRQKELEEASLDIDLDNNRDKSAPGALNGSSSGQFEEETALYDMENAVSNDNFHLSPTFKGAVNRDSWFDNRCKSRDLLDNTGNETELDQVIIEGVNIGGETVEGSEVEKINVAVHVQDEFCQHDAFESFVEQMNQLKVMK